MKSIFEKKIKILKLQLLENNTMQKGNRLKSQRFVLSGNYDNTSEIHWADL